MSINSEPALNTIGVLIENEIKNLAEKYRTEWNIDLCESINIEEFGLNEYLGGKAEAFEESLEIIKKYFHEVLKDV